MDPQNESIVSHAEQALRERLFCAGCIWHGACAFHESIPEGDPLRARARRRAARAPRRLCGNCNRAIDGLVEALRWSDRGLTHDVCGVSPSIDPLRDVLRLPSLRVVRAPSAMARRASLPRQPRLPRSIVPSELECGHYSGTQTAMRWGLEPLCRLEPCASIVRGLHAADRSTRVRKGRR